MLNNRDAFVNANYRETPEPLWPSLAPSKVCMLRVRLTFEVDREV